MKPRPRQFFSISVGAAAIIRSAADRIPPVSYADARQLAPIVARGLGEWVSETDPRRVGGFRLTARGLAWARTGLLRGGPSKGARAVLRDAVARRNGIAPGTEAATTELIRLGFGGVIPTSLTGWPFSFQVNARGRAWVEAFPSENPEAAR